MSTKISQLTSATDVTANDLIQIVDVEDGVMAPSGTNKKATASLLAKELAKQPLEPGVVISGSSSGDAVRITQTGSGNALVVEDSTNPDSNPFIIANNGNVAIGSTIAPNDALKVRRTGNENVVLSTDAETGVNYIVQNKFSSDANGNNFQFRKYRGAIGSLSSAQNNDVIGSFDALGYDGTNLVLSAQISAQVDGVPGTGDMPGRLTFSTTADGASTPTERMRIDSAGNVGIGTNSPSYQLQLSTDSAAKPSTSTWTISSDERLKENIEAADLDICYNAVKNIPLKRYKWKDEIYSAEQVTDRSKIGWIAQDVQAVFPKAVNEHKFVYNQVKDEDGNVVSEDSIDDCLSLNSDQIYAALFGAVQKLMGEVELLQGRIAELEAAP